MPSSDQISSSIADEYRRPGVLLAGFLEILCKIYREFAEALSGNLILQQTELQAK